MLHDKATTSQPLALIRAGSRGGDGTPSPILAAGWGGLDLAGGPPSPSEPLVLHRDPHGAGAEGEHGPGEVLPEGGAPLKGGGEEEVW